MISLKKILDKHLDEEDKEVLLISLKDLDPNDEDDFIEIIKLFFYYDLEFGENALRYILENVESIELRIFAERLLLEIQDIKIKFDKEDHNIKSIICSSIDKICDEFSIGDGLIKKDKYTKKESDRIKYKTRHPNNRLVDFDYKSDGQKHETELIKIIVDNKRIILKLLLTYKIGSQSIIELLNMIELKELQATEVFEYISGNKLENLITNIQPIKNIHSEIDKLRDKLFVISSDKEERRRVRGAINRRNNRILGLLEGWNLKDIIIENIENFIKDQIDWYEKTKQMFGYYNDQTTRANIIERERLNGIKFRRLIHVKQQIEKCRTRINNAKEFLVISAFPIVDLIAQNYSGKGLSQEDLIGSGNIGLSKAINEFEYQITRGHLKIISKE